RWVGGLVAAGRRIVAGVLFFEPAAFLVELDRGSLHRFRLGDAIAHQAQGHALCLPTDELDGELIDRRELGLRSFEIADDAVHFAETVGRCLSAFERALQRDAAEEPELEWNGRSAGARVRPRDEGWHAGAAGEGDWKRRGAVHALRSHRAKMRRD